MQRLQTIRGRRKLRPARLEEFLKAPIHELRNLAADHHPRPHRHPHPMVLGLFEHNGAAMLTDTLLICDAWSILNIELQTAKFAENFVPRALSRLFEHGSGFP